MTLQVAVAEAKPPLAIVPVADSALRGCSVYSPDAADDVRAVIRDMPADRIIVETDCPYLAPVPHRGRRNEPAFLPAVLAGLATVRGWTPQEAEARCEDAFFALFDRIPRP